MPTWPRRTCSSDDVSVLLNNGDGMFAPHATFAAGEDPSALAIGDLDGDDDADMAVPSSPRATSACC